jgi:hypothetical protein
MTVGHPALPDRQRIFLEESRDRLSLWAVGTGWDRLAAGGEMFSAMPAFSRCHYPLRSAPSLDGHHIGSDKFS